MHSKNSCATMRAAVAKAIPMLLAILASHNKLANSKKCDGVLNLALFLDRDLVPMVGPTHDEQMDVLNVLISSVQQIFDQTQVDMIIRLTHTAEFAFNGTSDASLSLQEFCQYQSLIEKKSDASRHHALLLTSPNRLNMDMTNNGTSTSKHLLSIGNHNQICSQNWSKSCSIVEFASPSLSKTPLLIVYELSRAMGLKDDAGECLRQDEDGIQFVMSSGIQNVNTSVGVEWSECSKSDLRTFVASNAQCISTNKGGKDLLKGLEYNPMGIDKQCGPGQQANNQTGNVCKSLKCVNQTSGLVSEFKTGALLGTHCGLDDGNRGICERWQCVDKEVPDLCPKCDVTIEDSTSSTVEIIVDIVEKVTSIWDQLRKLFHF